MKEANEGFQEKKKCGQNLVISAEVDIQEDSCILYSR